MVAAAQEYCTLVDGFSGFGSNREWMARMSKLLPRLHVAVIALTPPGQFNHRYHFPDDDARCELYMRLHSAIDDDYLIWTLCGNHQVRHALCDSLADDFTDMYFDLKGGLELLSCDPQQAMEDWQCSFYLHWGRHLLDAEYWLKAVDYRARPWLFN